MRSRTELILWTGAKHSGKTTRAAQLVESLRKENFDVAGVLAPSLYAGRELIGFDVLDLQNKRRAPLFRVQGDADKGGFETIEAGLQLGCAALDRAFAASADLVVVDEFGPMELKGRIWRKNVDSLLASGGNSALLVVRQELVQAVRELYIDNPSRELEANAPESIDRVIRALKERRREREPHGGRSSRIETGSIRIQTES